METANTGNSGCSEGIGCPPGGVLTSPHGVYEAGPIAFLAIRIIPPNTVDILSLSQGEPSDSGILAQQSWGDGSSLPSPSTDGGAESQPSTDFLEVTELISGGQGPKPQFPGSQSAWQLQSAKLSIDDAQL